MGATTFSDVVGGESPQSAFSSAAREARYAYGHAGYTGTIAEKDSFVLIPCEQGQSPYKLANQLIDEGDERVDSKWGPAGCIEIEGEFLERIRARRRNETIRAFLFFGWASE